MLSFHVHDKVRKVPNNFWREDDREGKKGIYKMANTMVFEANSPAMVKNMQIRFK